MKAGVGVEPWTYAAWFRTELGRRVWRDERRALKHVIGPLEGHRVLDAGCGPGQLSAELALLGANVIGVDLSETMLRAARVHTGTFGVDVGFAAADIETLPFADGAFDRVVAVTVLCILPDPLAAALEMARVTRPGGRVVLGELGRWSAWALNRRWRGRRGDGLWARARFWSPGELRSLLIEAGLRPVETSSAVYYPPVRSVARVVAPLERWLGRRTSVGAAFIAIGAEKPAM